MASERGGMMRLIDADEVQKIIDHIRGKYVNSYGRRNKVSQLFWDTVRYIEKKVRSIPTVDAVPVVHGSWVESESDIWFCSVCDSEAYWDTDYGQQLFGWCPYCGAKMDGKKVQE
jgi:hypothetical protein